MPRRKPSRTAKSRDASSRKPQASLLEANRELKQRLDERTGELEKQSEKLRAMARLLAEAESRERKRLARLLHDHFQQLISAAKLKIGIMRRNSRSPEMVESFLQAESLLEEAVTTSRNLATELSPTVLHDAGLAAAFNWLARNLEKNNRLNVKLTFAETYRDPDDQHIQTVLFESVRELLLNVSRHAGVESAAVSAEITSEGLLHIEVVDHGKGFDAMNVEGHNGLDGAFGLFSIRERLSHIGGLMNIVTAPGKGTCIDLTVPVELKAPGIFRAADPTAVIEHPANSPHPEFRVVVADDHKIFRQGLTTLLGQEAFLQVIGEANDGNEAVDLVRKLRPDILIVDVSMPGLTGVQVTSILSREFPKLKIIGLSMHEHADMAHAMRQAGAVAYCVKNAPVETLIDIIRRAANEAEPAVKA